jgi:hydrogenase expression/formation protein HypD
MKNEKRINLMEVCGTHTMAIARNALKSKFPENVTMLSGPGCPVCVTPAEMIDAAIEISKLPGVIVTTFGDMLRVPGSASSLEKERAAGADVKMVYSPYDALEMAVSQSKKQVVFLGVGFETTSPAIAATVIWAKKRKAGNFTVLSMFKTIPNALKAILAVKGRRIDGFLLPGHVSAIIGEQPYAFLSGKYGIPGVISGFEPYDILKSVEILLGMINAGKASIVNQYTRIVNPEGNPIARKTINTVFEEADSAWRGIGCIPKSGLIFKRSYSAFDAARRFKIKITQGRENTGCICGNILTGLNGPQECKLFGKACTPQNPIGPCMVSSEGACAAQYKYGNIKNRERY